VFPFNRFMGVDIVLGPGNAIDGRSHGHRCRLRSGICQGPAGCGFEVANDGQVFISMSASHKHRMIEPARRLKSLGYQIVCTSGTARVFQEAGIDVDVVRKVQEGRPNLLDLMANGEIHLIFNTPSGKGARTDEGKIRAASVTHGVPCVTTMPDVLPS
jgi:carbamoyl-phosphate synthase large subunit